MKYNGFYNIENGAIDVRAYDPENDADDPWYGFGDAWNSAGSWDTYAEAIAAAEEAAETLRQVVIRRAGTSPAEYDNYAIIGIGDPIPDGWFVKTTVDTYADADLFIDDSVRWCRWNGIGWPEAEKDTVFSVSEPEASDEDDELLSDLILRKIAGK